MDTPLSLDDVQFQQWREQKPSPQCRVPLDIKHKAISLRDRHTIKDIAKAIKATATRFRSWYEQPAQDLSWAFQCACLGL